MSQKLLCESYLSQSKWDLVAAALEATAIGSQGVLTRPSGFSFPSPQVWGEHREKGAQLQELLLLCHCTEGNSDDV